MKPIGIPAIKPTASPHNTATNKHMPLQGKAEPALQPAPPAIEPSTTAARLSFPKTPPPSAGSKRGRRDRVSHRLTGPGAAWPRAPDVSNHDVGIWDAARGKRRDIPAPQQLRHDVMFAGRTDQRRLHRRSLPQPLSAWAVPVARVIHDVLAERPPEVTIALWNQILA